MSKVIPSALTDSLFGKLDPKNKVSFRRGLRRTHTYTLRNPSKAAPTEQMKNARNTFAEAQAFYATVAADPAQLESWRKRYVQALREHAKHPEMYANKRREELLSAGKRVRESQLEFPVTLRGYIISCFVRGLV